MSTEQQEIATEEQQEGYTSFMHLHANKGRITAAIDVDSTRKNKIANIALAFCSPKDQFCRKTGRLISEGRLSKGKYFYQISLDSTKGVKDTIRQAIYKDIKDGTLPGCPRWVTG